MLSVAEEAAEAETVECSVAVAPFVVVGTLW